MLFAVLDYFAFRSRRGRYSRHNSSELMSYGFEENIPEEIIKNLKEGDTILLASFNWWVSWLITYLTSSQVSHVALYIGERKIIHATLSGTVIQPIETLFEPRGRILVVRLLTSEEKVKTQDRAVYEDLLGRPYGYSIAIIKGMRILAGRDWSVFRWKFFVDLALLLFLLDIPFLFLVKVPVFSIITLVLLLTILVNAFLWRVKPLPQFEADTGKPVDMLALAVRMGGKIILDESLIKNG